MVTPEHIMGLSKMHNNIFKNQSIMVFMGLRKSAVLYIAAINLIFFVLQIASPAFENAFILVGSDVLSRPWILLTSMFLHGGMNHLLVNMLSLILLGPILEGTIGMKRFLTAYLGSGLAAGLLASFFYPRALGASGALMGMFGVMIILMPRLKLLIFGIVPMDLWLVGILYAAMDIFGVMHPSGVGNIAHLSGMAAGLFYGLYLTKQSKKFHKKFSSKKHMDEFDSEEYLKSGRI
jgi:uncharacterized protein